MSSLDNFHTGNTPGGFFPTIPKLNQAVIKGLHYPGEWDIQNKVPVGPFQPPCDTALHLTNRPDPTLTEKRDNTSNDLFVATRPYTKRIQGDTVDSMLLVPQKYSLHPGPDIGTTRCPYKKLVARMKNLVPIKTSVLRFKPY